MSGPGQHACTEECEARQKCAVCGRRKKPLGRSAPAEMYGSLCSYDCDGYLRDPRPGHLWPGELARIRQDEDEAEQVAEGEVGP